MTSVKGRDSACRERTTGYLKSSFELYDDNACRKVWIYSLAKLAKEMDAAVLTA